MPTAVPMDPPLLPKLNYPPFPDPPPGKTIVKFVDWDESTCAIRAYNADNSIEVDGMGVQTVAVSKRHGTDRCKSNRKPIPGMSMVGDDEDATAGATHRVRQDLLDVWWGTGRVGSFADVPASREEKLKMAADEFLKPWPKGVAAGQRDSVPWLWDQFRLFAGLLYEAPTFRKVTGSAETADAIPDEEDDAVDSDDEGLPKIPTESFNKQFKESSDVPLEATEEAINEMNAPKPPYQERTNIQSLDEIPAHKIKAEKRTQDALGDFAADIPGKVRTFLSHYIMMKTMNIHEANLTIFPRLIKYYLMFARNSRAIPGNSGKKIFHRAIENCDLAYKELPVTKQLAQALPDTVSLEARAIWGSQVPQPFWGLGSDTLGETSARIEEVVEPTPAAPETSDNWGAGGGWGNDAPGRGGESNDTNAGWGNANGDGWGSGKAEDDSAPVEMDISDDVNPWKAEETNVLISLLGPTALPSLYTTGIVERSLRKIKAVYRPGEGPIDENATGIEVELYKRLGRVVMSPWIGWSDVRPPGGDYPYSKPEILSTSVGDVVDPSSMTVDSDSSQDRSEMCYDPMNDDITLLIEPIPKNLKMFENGIGIGLGAVWVQLIEDLDVNAEVDPQGRYWFMEQLSPIHPSYYSEKGTRGD